MFIFWLFQLFLVYLKFEHYFRLVIFKLYDDLIWKFASLTAAIQLRDAVFYYLIVLLEYLLTVTIMFIKKRVDYVDLPCRTLWQSLAPKVVAATEARLLNTRLVTNSTVGSFRTSLLMSADNRTCLLLLASCHLELLHMAALLNKQLHTCIYRLLSFHRATQSKPCTVTYNVLFYKTDYFQKYSSESHYCPIVFLPVWIQLWLFRESKQYVYD